MCVRRVLPFILRSVCPRRLCALFWLRGCWCCPIMSSIISPVNMAKSSCPWEKLWKGECQYWQTNKFWQRGDSLGHRSRLQTQACRQEPWRRRWMFIILSIWTCHIMWGAHQENKYNKEIEVLQSLPHWNSGCYKGTNTIDTFTIYSEPGKL